MPKTGPSDADVRGFIAAIDDPVRRADCESLLEPMSRATGEPPIIWGTGIVGFGRYHYRYESGREGVWFKVGFAPRSRKLTLYLLSGTAGYHDLLSKLGPHTSGKSCVYLRRLDDVDREVLGALIERSVAHIDEVEADRGAIPRMSAMPPPKRTPSSAGGT